VLERCVERRFLEAPVFPVVTDESRDLEESTLVALDPSGRDTPLIGLKVEDDRCVVFGVEEVFFVPASESRMTSSSFSSFFEPGSFGRFCFLLVVPPPKSGGIQVVSTLEERRKSPSDFDLCLLCCYNVTSPFEGSRSFELSPWGCLGLQEI
jgi:hypothetical protein